MFITSFLVFLGAVAIAVVLCYLLALCLSLSVVFSRTAVCLILATGFAASAPFVANGFLNYVIWAAICLGVCFLLCRLPRVDGALTFFCTAAASYIVVLLVSHFLLDNVLKLELSGTWRIVIEIAMRLTVIFISGVTLRWEFGKVDVRKFSNVVVVNIERLIASVLYGVCFTLIVLGNLPVTLPDWSIIAALIGFTAVAFAVDCVYISKKL